MVFPLPPLYRTLRRFPLASLETNPNGTKVGQNGGFPLVSLLTRKRVRGANSKKGATAPKKKCPPSAPIRGRNGLPSTRPVPGRSGRGSPADRRSRPRPAWGTRSFGIPLSRKRLDNCLAWWSINTCSLGSRVNQKTLLNQEGSLPQHNSSFTLRLACDSLQLGPLVRFVSHFRFALPFPLPGHGLLAVWASEMQPEAAVSSLKLAKSGGKFDVHARMDLCSVDLGRGPLSLRPVRQSASDDHPKMIQNMLKALPFQVPRQKKTMFERF